MGNQVQKIMKKFGDYTALDQIDLTEPAGELAARLGPSGSGKTALPHIEHKRLDNGLTVQTEPLRGQHRQLSLKTGGTAFIRPTKGRIFVPDIQI